MLNKSTEEGLLEKLVSRNILDIPFTPQEQGEAILYISGKVEKCPIPAGNHNTYLFRALDLLPEIQKQYGDDGYIRSLSFLYNCTDNTYMRNQIYGLILEMNFLFKGIAHSEDTASLYNKRLQIAQMIDTYFGEANVTELMKHGLQELYASKGWSSDYPNTSLLLSFLVQVRPAYLELLEENIPALLYSVLAKDTSALAETIGSITDLFVLTQELPSKENQSSALLSKDYLSSLRKPFQDILLAQGKQMKAGAIPHNRFSKWLYHVAGTWQFLIFRAGSQQSLLENEDEMAQSIHGCIRALYATAPIDLLRNLFLLDGYYLEKLAICKLTEGLLEVDEVIEFLLKYEDWTIHSLFHKKNRIELIAENPALAQRALEIAANPLVIAMLLRELLDCGSDIPDASRRLDDLVLSLYKEKNSLYRYLSGELSFDDLRSSAPKDADSSWGLFDLESTFHPMMLALIEETSLLNERLYVVISHSSYRPNDMRNLMDDGFARCIAWHAAYRDNPNASSEQFVFLFLETLLSMIGRPEGKRAELLEAFVLNNHSSALAQFKNMSAATKEGVLDILFANKEQLSSEVIVQGLEAGLSDTSKGVNAVAINQLNMLSDAQSLIHVYQNSKKAKAKEEVLAAVKKHADREAIYRELLKKESNKVFAQLLEQLLLTLHMTPAEAHDALGQVVDPKKLARLSWLDLDSLPLLQAADGTELSRAVNLYILTQSMDYTDENPIIEEVKTYAKTEPFAKFTLAVLDNWLSSGSSAKEKWVLFLAAPLGGRELVDRLAAQIVEWTETSRGAIAAEAVKALAYSGELSSLRAIDVLKTKIKNKQVKQAAADALELAAAQLGISSDELEDRLVPSLGFDQEGRRVFDYGARAFTVQLNNDLELRITSNETGKIVKSLPAAGATDDAEKAAAAKKEFTLLKKDLKGLVAIQAQRLENSLSRQRLWNASAWQSLFVENKWMQKFAIQLIWGAYDNGQLVQTFRYMEDGTFNSVDEDEVTLGEDQLIGLVHPLELDEEEIASWQSQLEDYELIQPFAQLERKVFLLEEEQAEEKSITELPKQELSPTGFPRLMEKLGWRKGPIEDAGWYHYFIKDYGTVVAELSFSGTSVTYYEGLDPIVLQTITFYPQGHTSRYYGQQGQGLALGTISNRIYSETMVDINKASGIN